MYLRKLAVGGVISAAVLGLGIAGTTSASAATVRTAASPASASVIDEWFPTYYDCVYYGDVYAQEGYLTTFACVPAAVTGWYLLGN